MSNHYHLAVETPQGNLATGMHWQEALARAMARLPARARETRHKSAPWKVAVATYLKTSTDGSNTWLATELAMGSSR